MEKDRKYIIETLVNGLSRLEYRGYDSAGLAVDGDKKNEVMLALPTHDGLHTVNLHVLIAILTAPILAGNFLSSIMVSSPITKS